MLVVIGAEVGWMACWYAFDKVFYQPLRKQHKAALKGWGETNELLMKIGVMQGWVKREDGSMVSPFQVTKHESDSQN